MGIRVANNAVSALSVSIDGSSTSLQVRTGEGDRFPLLAEGQWFPATIISTDGAIEIIKVTGRDGDILTAERGQECTVARSFLAGSPVELRLTAEIIVQALSKIGDVSNAASVAQGTANTGVSKAEDAHETAGQAIEDADAAQNTANNAGQAASDAYEAAGIAGQAASRILAAVGAEASLRPAKAAPVS